MMEAPQDRKYLEYLESLKTPRVVNIPFHTLDRATVPDTWKVWTSNGADGLICVAVFAFRDQAVDWALERDDPRIVTRHHVTAMSVEDDNEDQ